jgi:hypothetical protein
MACNIIVGLSIQISKHYSIDFVQDLIIDKNNQFLILLYLFGKKHVHFAEHLLQFLSNYYEKILNSISIREPIIELAMIVKASKHSEKS